MVVRRTHISRAMKSIGAGEGGDWLSDNFVLGAEPTYVPLSRSILGTCIIRDRETYALIEVSRRAPLRGFVPGDMPRVPTSSAGGTASSTTDSSYAKSDLSAEERRVYNKIEVPGQLDVAKIVVSVLQLIWGISTLYNARGNQIQLYGYAAFGLTVAPYAVMSFLNLLVSLLLPVHTNIYLVWNEDMKEAMETRYEGGLAGEFYGMIAATNDGKLARRRAKGRSPITWNYGTLSRPYRLFLNIGFYIVIAILPLAIFGGFTGFKTGSDVHTARAWILAWLIVGSASAILIQQISGSVTTHPQAEYFQDFITGRRSRRRRDKVEKRYRMMENGPGPFFALFILLPLWLPAIGGMVVVGQMIQAYGVCTRVN